MLSLYNSFYDGLATAFAVFQNNANYLTPVDILLGHVCHSLLRVLISLTA